MKNRLESLLNLFEKDPKDSFVIYGIALEYVSSKDFQNAEKYFEILLNKDPNYIPGYMQLAQLKEKLNLITDAKVIYRQGIEKAKTAGDRKSALEMEEFLNELE